MNNGPPFYYDYQNVADGIVMPSTVHVTNTALSRYFVRYLLQKVISVFEWHLPENWAEDYFKYVLYCFGFIAIINTDKYGVICQQCGLRGYDVFYRPTNAVITNPLINRSLEPRIGTQCTLIKLQPDYGGIMDLVTYYGDLFALISEGIAVSALNAKNTYVFAADDKNIAQSMKKLYDQIASGEPAVVVNKKLFDPNTGDLHMKLIGDGKATTIVNDLLIAFQAVSNMFDKDIGLPVSPTNIRKERFVEAEVDNNTITSVSKIGMWLQELRKSCAEANRMFGLNISVDWRNPPKEVRENESNTKPGRDVQLRSDDI